MMNYKSVESQATRLVSGMTQENDEKIAIVYARVSTSMQEVSSQIEMGKQAARELGYSDDCVMIISDAGVSARSKEMHERQGLVKLLQMVRSGRVGHVIIRDRDRLARKMIEYLQVWQIIVHSGGQLYLSDKGAVPVKNNFGEEATYALMAEIEGDKIAERTASASRFYPPAPFGYQKVGKKGATHYEFTAEIDLARDMFKDFQSIQTKEEYEEFRVKWKQQIGRYPDRILQNPLYAAAIPDGDGVQKVHHITPIADEQVILNNRSMLQSWGFGTNEKEQILPSRVHVPIYCARCGDELSERTRKGERWYFCRNCRPIKFGEADITEKLSVTIREMLSQIDPTVIERRVVGVIYSVRHRLMQSLDDKLQLRSKLELNILDHMQFNRFGEMFKQYEELQRSIEDTMDDLQKSNEALSRLGYLRDQVLGRLKSDAEDNESLQEIVIHSLRVDKGYIEVIHRFADILGKEGIA